MDRLRGALATGAYEITDAPDAPGALFLAKRKRRAWLAAGSALHFFVIPVRHGGTTARDILHIEADCVALARSIYPRRHTTIVVVPVVMDSKPTPEGTKAVSGKWKQELGRVVIPAIWNGKKLQIGRPPAFVGILLQPCIKKEMAMVQAALETPTTGKL